jgi:2-polyprenyl-3-methyl-5-hydroxy-6-metoxy-1,4-benzoquinol methylase
LTGELASKSYWDQVWSRAPAARPIDPRDRSLRNHLSRQFDRFFREILAPVPPCARLLEVGCARSRWLPYFAREHSLHVSGIDYSEQGCEQARAVLRAARVDGDVRCADLFAPPQDFRSAFDVVVSFGLVEHFPDTAAVLRAIGEYAAPGGFIVTFIPNMTGATGRAMRLLNAPVYRKHVPLGRDNLARAHRLAGLDPVLSRWFATCNFGVVNLNGVLPGTLDWYARSAALTLLLGITAGTWLVEELGVRLPARGALSPYVVCVARRG